MTPAGCTDWLVTLNEEWENWREYAIATVVDLLRSENGVICLANLITLLDSKCSGDCMHVSINNSMIVNDQISDINISRYVHPALCL